MPRLIEGDAPDDALQRVLWLAEYRRLVLAELDEALAQAYFLARQEGRLAAALEMAPHSRRQAVAMTRRENERSGRVLRWRDEFVDRHE